MTPVTQTKVVVKNNAGDIVVQGNCYAAVIATILDLPITEVPNGEVFFNDRTDDMFYEGLMQRFLGNRGLRIIKDYRFAIFHGRHFDEPDKTIIHELLKDKYYLATGKSCRGFDHICVYQNGELIHDPHPSKDGLLTVFEWEIISPL